MGGKSVRGEQLGEGRRWRLADTDWNHWPDHLADAAIVAAVAAAGLRGVELGVYSCAGELAPDRLARLRRLSAAHGVAVVALLLSLTESRWPGGALSCADADTAARLEAEVVSAARVAADLGHPVLGLWPGADPPGSHITGTLARLAARTAPLGVRLAVEYKPGTAVADAAEALALARAVPGTAVLLDTGHAWAAGEDPAAVVTALGPLLGHVHLGDAPAGAQDADLPLGRLHPATALVAALDTIGYAGWASFDLYGAVLGGALTGRAAVAESLRHLADPVGRGGAGTP